MASAGHQMFALVIRRGMVVRRIVQLVRSLCHYYYRDSLNLASQALTFQACVLLEERGLTKHMPQTLLTRAQNAQTQEYVTEELEIVNVLQDSLETLANEVRACLPYISAHLSSNRNYAISFVSGVCPADCSGHGVCSTIGDVSLYEGPDYDPTYHFSGDGFGPQYINWDKNSIQLCECDQGFFGADCSRGKLLCAICCM